MKKYVLILMIGATTVACDPILGAKGVVRSAPTPACDGAKTDIALTPPVVDANVQVRCANGEGGETVILETKSDGDGRFSTGTVGSGQCKLRVEKAGYKTRDVPLVCRNQDGSPQDHGMGCLGRVYVEIEKQ